jgi:hypothetical protein
MSRGTLHAPPFAREVTFVELDTVATGADFILAATTVTGGGAVTGIFEAGVWCGIIGVMAILFLGMATLGFLKPR